MTDHGELHAIRELVRQAEEAASGGISTAGDRLLQHRPLINALKAILLRYEQDTRLDSDLQAAFKALLVTLKQYPAIGSKDPAAEPEWRVRYAPQFNLAVKRIAALIDRAEKIGE